MPGTVTTAASAVTRIKTPQQTSSATFLAFSVTQNAKYVALDGYRLRLFGRGSGAAVTGGFGRLDRHCVRRDRLGFTAEGEPLRRASVRTGRAVRVVLDVDDDDLTGCQLAVKDL